MTVAAAVAMALAPGRRATALRGVAPEWPHLAGMYPQGDWHVDDICGHMPRYAHPIPYLHDAAAPDYSVGAAPVDRQFLS